jgi:hypothetical protein
MQLDGQNWRLIAVNISSGEIQLIGNESFPFYQMGGFAGNFSPVYDFTYHLVGTIIVNSILAIVTVNAVEHRLHLLQSTHNGSMSCSTLVTLDSVSGAMVSTVTIKPPQGMDFSPTLPCLTPFPAQNLVVDISTGSVYVMWYYNQPRGTQFILRVDWRSGASSIAGTPDNMYILNGVRTFDPLNQLYYFQGARTKPSSLGSGTPPRPIPRLTAQKCRLIARRVSADSAPANFFLDSQSNPLECKPC